MGPISIGRGPQALRGLRASQSGVVVLMVVGIFAGCTSAASPVPTAAPTPTVAPTPSPASTLAPTPSPASSVTADPFAGQPYALTVPAGWRAFNMADPATKAALDAVIAANPGLGSSITAFQAIPGVRLLIDPLLGDEMIAFTSPSGGLPLATLAQSFGAQFQVVPGLQGKPKPVNETLPGGDAVHWDIAITANKPGGGTISVSESVYLLASPTDAVILEFVTPAGGVIPDETSIVNSFVFNP